MDKLTKREKDYLKQACSKGFLEIINSCGVNLRNAFWDFCRDNDIPRLILTKTRYYINIDLDFMTVNYDLTENERKIFEEIYSSYYNLKSEYSFSQIFIIIKKNKLENYNDFKIRILKTMRKIITLRGIEKEFFQD